MMESDASALMKDKGVLNTNLNLSVFRTRGPSTGPTSEFVAACPCPDGLMQDGT
jgi:hypothetical protein